MTWTLGIDTAGPVVSAALCDAAGNDRGTWSERVVRGADGVLLPAVAALLDTLTEEGATLRAVAVATGPGGFTGLRVGVATALGLAFARQVPVVPVSSLAARAQLVQAPRVLSLLDARKGKVYAGLYDARGPEPVLLSPEVDVPLETLLPCPDTVAVGEGAARFADALTAAGLRLARDPAQGAALAVARLSLRREPVDPTAVQLRYLRPADAKLPAPGKGIILPRSSS